ncbi:SEA/GATOR complex protein SEA4/MIOS, partial [Tremellales sp. Uapishka_1]
MSIHEARRVALSDPLSKSGRPARFVVAGAASQTASGDVRVFSYDEEAIAWSPSPVHTSLFALGLSTGRTLLVSLPSSTLSLPTSSLPQNTIAALAVKHSRPITAISFSSLDPNYVATGLERHRSDYSLLIWDVADVVAPTPASTPFEGDWKRPLERLEILNPLYATPQLKPTATPEPRHIQHYCPSEVVHSTAFVPNTMNLLLASAQNKIVRLYDLRVATSSTPSANSSSGAAMSWTTRAVNAVTPDPLSPRFASFESTANGGSVVRLWDTRKTGEVANFETVDPVIGMEWMQGGTAGLGRLGVGCKDGGVGIWDVVSGKYERERGKEEEWSSLGGVRNIVKPKNLHSFTFAPSSHGALGCLLFVSKDGSINIGPIESPPVVCSFASFLIIVFVNDPSPQLATSPRGDIAISSSRSFRVLDPQIHPFSSTFPSAPPSEADLDIDRETDLGHNPARPPSQLDLQAPAHEETELRYNRFQLAPERVNKLLQEAGSRPRSVSPSTTAVLRGVTPHTPAIVPEKVEFDDGDEVSGREGWRRVLRNDVAYIMRRRVEEGYGLEDLMLNAAIATKFAGKARIGGIWESINHLTQVMSPSTSLHRSLDLTYHGIWSIWSGSAPAFDGTAAETLKEYTQSIEYMNNQRESLGTKGAPGSHVLPRSEKTAQRRMILSICGENHGGHGKQEVERLVRDNQRTKAGCWAFFSGDETNAINILINSEDERHRLMGSTIAGFITQSKAARGSVFYQEHWRTLINRVDDPYIRAVLTRVAGEDWDEVLFEEALPLLDRIAIAVCNLDDKELTNFLQNRRKKCMDRGSLHGLALTGFTSDGITIVQNWLNKTGDLQTSALLSVYFHTSKLLPRERELLHRWQEDYKTMMDSWRCYLQRSKFDIGRKRLGLGDGPDGMGELQTMIVCPVCHNLLTKQTEQHLFRKGVGALRGTITQTSVRTNVCLFCLESLPRCVICLLHVQPISPDPDEDEVIGHANHILPWFHGGLQGEPAHSQCPVSGCKCECATI